MKSKDIEEVIDLLFFLPRIMRTFMQKEIFTPSLEFIPKDLAPHHLLIMKIVYDGDMLCISEISENTTISKAQMTRSIDKLTELGMLKRLDDPRDLRKTGIVLTEQGKDTIVKVDAAIKKRLKENLSRLSDKEAQQLLTSLRYLVTTFEKPKHT